MRSTAQGKHDYLLHIKTLQRKTTKAIMPVFITIHTVKTYSFGTMTKIITGIIFD